MKNQITSLLILITLLFTLCLPATTAEPMPNLSGIAPGGVCTVDGVTYVTDRYHRAIVAVSAEGETILTGKQEPVDGDNRPVAGYEDGSLDEAVFGEPWGVVPYRGGLLVADRANGVLRVVDLQKDTVSTLDATFVAPTDLAVGADCVYVADSGTHAVYAVDQAGAVTLVLDGLSYPMGLCYADGTLYIADAGSYRILAYRDDTLTVVAGALLTGDMAIEGDLLDGPAATARFSAPADVLAVGDTLYIADSGNGAIRLCRDGFVTTLTDDMLVCPDMLAAVGDTVYGGDSFHRTMTALPAIPVETVFDDVPSDQAAVVRFAVANGLMNGTGGGHFSPERTLTRGMAVTVLARMDGMDTTTGAEYYTVGMDWALDCGISDGTNPTDPITLEQLLTMLYRYVGEPAVEPMPGPGDLPAQEAVLPYPSDFAVATYTWAKEGDMLTGCGTIAPQDALTRMQFANVVMRFLLGLQG